MRPKTVCFNYKFQKFNSLKRVTSQQTLHYCADDAKQKDESHLKKKLSKETNEKEQRKRLSLS
jgi:hypothetical protein